jgi:hypothetical protein
MVLQKNTIVRQESHPPQGLSEARRVREVSGVLLLPIRRGSVPSGAAALILTGNKEAGINHSNKNFFVGRWFSRKTLLCVRRVTRLRASPRHGGSGKFPEFFCYQSAAGASHGGGGAHPKGE